MGTVIMHFVKIATESTVRHKEISLLTPRAFIKENAVKPAMIGHDSGLFIAIKSVGGHPDYCH
ncbi:hypothetical protein GCM10027085_31620 [Spirosoma aerophilum]